MPLSRYDRFYGGKPGAAAKAAAAMRETYGPVKGRQVFAAKARVEGERLSGRAGLRVAMRAERKRRRSLR